MLAFKNKHAGERCFIIGTGPSLTFEDIEKLKDEITIGVNSMALVYDKISYKLTYYGIGDGNTMPRLKESIYKCNYGTIFWCRHSVLCPWSIDKKDVKDDWVEFPLVDSFSEGILSPRYNIYPTTRFFSGDAGAAVYGHYTIVTAMLQIACYMGFSEIYLLGCDCNYKKDVPNFTGYMFKDYICTPSIESYKAAKKFADSHGIKIYNATRGGILEVFERVDLDEVLRSKKK